MFARPLFRPAHCFGSGQDAQEASGVVGIRVVAFHEGETPHGVELSAFLLLRLLHSL